MTIRPAAGVFPTGMHEVVIAVDSAPMQTCTFDFPIAGDPGSVASGSCNGDGVFLTVSPVQECTSRVDGNVASQTCRPVPGQFEERIQIQGNAAHVRITQRTIGGGKYLDQEVSATYAEVFPNGPRCGPVCKQAGVSWTF